MEKKILIIIGILMISLLFLNVVQAEITPSPDPATLSFSLGSYLKHVLGLNLIGPFSVAGNARNCGDGNNPNKVITVNAGETFSHPASDYCSSGYGFFDIYLGVEYKPWYEYKDNVAFSCSKDKCYVEVYCCPEKECTTSNGVCPSGSICKTSTDKDPVIPFGNFASWNYCTTSNFAICWAIDNSICKNVANYSGRTDCPPTWNLKKLYSSKSICEDNICLSNEKRCKSTSVRQLCVSGAWIDETCSSGQTCTNGACVNSGECPGQTKCSDGVCRDDCGGSETGKTISLTEDAYNDATPEMIAQAMCRLPGECSKTEIYDMEEGLEAENYTVTCKSTTSIREANREAVLQYLTNEWNEKSDWEKFKVFLQDPFNLQNPANYEYFCGQSSFLGTLAKIGNWFSGKDQCKTTLSNIPKGTCRATVKPSSISYCQFTEWASLGIFKDQTKCKDGLYTLLIGLGILIIGIPLIQGSRK